MTGHAESVLRFARRLTPRRVARFAFGVLRPKERIARIRAVIPRRNLTDAEFLLAMRSLSWAEAERKVEEPLLAPDARKRLEESKRLFPDFVERSVRRAEGVLAHRFDLLGSGDTDLGPRIDWHRDFKTGKRWDARRHFLSTRDYVRSVPGGDVKVPWELSRFQHATALGVAWLSTNDPRYPREFEAQVDDWLRANPCSSGVNWACTMDVAIRAVNWLWGYDLMRDGLTRESRRRLLKALFLHGRHIHRFPEWGEIRGNHYLADVAGLAILGAVFRRAPEGRTWLKTAREALEREVLHQTYADGSNFEGSTNYHRLSTELFLTPALVLHRIGEPVSEAYRERLRGMARFAAAYSRPDGSWPQLGDTDDGRLQIVDSASMEDHRYLVNAIAGLLEDPGLEALAPRPVPESLWLLGDLAQPADRPPTAPPPSTDAFPDGGYYFLGNRSLGDWSVIRCGPVGIPRSGGHGHCDALAVEIVAGGLPVLVDRGTGVYTPSPDVRNRYRATDMHNTLRIDRAEQNPYDPQALFQMPDQTKAECVAFGKGEFVGRHHGYLRLDPPVLHRRSFRYLADARTWEIHDTVEGRGRRLIEAFWHFDPRRRVELVGRTVRTDAGNLDFEPREGLTLRLESTTHSPSYGREEGAVRVVATLESGLPATLVARFAAGSNAARSFEENAR